MIKYVALLRGIGPMNPNMRNEKLRSVFENLEFENVKTVISSGNVLFESSEKDVAALEKLIEEALPAQLEFNSTTIIRSREQLLDLVAERPFKGHEHNQKTYLTVTFFKEKPNAKPPLPAWPTDRGYKLVGTFKGAICSIVDLTTGKTPDLMARLERQFGKQITTRTWKTVERILKAMDR